MVHNVKNDSQDLKNMKNNPTKENDNILLTIFEQNWLHIRHVENERILCLNAYVVILAAIFYAFTNINLNTNFKLFAPYMISFLLIFSVINFLLSLKIEAVIEDYVNRNEKIAEKLGMKEFAGLRVKSGIWRFIRLKYIFPSFYGIVSVALLVCLMRLIYG
ncbi:MAG: hypothetical protein KAV98_06555 [Dehalococcoidia bacterium]|nr:hypothetical protein [Dehalococcoidia bacterium]